MDDFEIEERQTERSQKLAELETMIHYAFHELDVAQECRLICVDEQYQDRNGVWRTHTVCRHYCGPDADAIELFVE